VDLSKLKLDVYDFLGIILPGLVAIAEGWVLLRGWRFWSGAWQRLERRLIGVHGEFSHWPEQVIATGIEHRSKEHQEFSGPRDEMRGPRDGSGWQICTTERKIGNPPSDVQASPDGLGRAAQTILAPRNCPSKKGEENV